MGIDIDHEIDGSTLIGSQREKQSMPLLEVLVPAVFGGPDVVTIVGWVGVAAMVVIIGFVVFLALGPSTQSQRTERTEPTPTDSDGRDASTEERSDAPTESGSH